jgi:hypothetical protein
VAAKGKPVRKPAKATKMRPPDSHYRTPGPTVQHRGIEANTNRSKGKSARY